MRDTKSQAYLMVCALSQSTKSHWCFKLEYIDDKIALKIMGILKVESIIFNY